MKIKIKTQYILYESDGVRTYNVKILKIFFTIHFSTVRALNNKTKNVSVCVFFFYF